MIRDHQQWMDMALAQAKIAQECGEIPVGAVVIAPDGKTLLSCGHNTTQCHHDPAGHAEIVALRCAAYKMCSARLVDCSLYVTLEPCTMCAGAIAQARISRLVFGAYDPQYGAICHGVQLFAQPWINHQPEIIGGINERECSAILQNFFREKRKILKN